MLNDISIICRSQVMDKDVRNLLPKAGVPKIHPKWPKRATKMVKMAETWIFVFYDIL